MSAAHRIRRTVGAGWRELFDGAKRHVFLAGGLDLGQIDVAIVGDFIALPGFDAQHARQVAGVVAGNFGSSVAHLVNKEPAAHTILYSS